MTSERKIQANKANALKCTGPKTAEGKARSRCNAIKHGLTGRGIVLPPEDQALFQQRMGAWTYDARPEGGIQVYLVAGAVLASVRADRCARNEFVAIGKRRNRAIANWDRRQERIVKAIVARLEEEPAESVAQLEQTATGCD